MPADLDAPAPPSEHWSWKKLLLIAFGILVALIAAILSYDSKLEPYDDLTPAAVQETDARTNGYLFLKERWEKLPSIAKPDEEKAMEMINGKKPWDSVLFQKLQSGQESIASDLKTALAMPEFSPPPPSPLNAYPFEGSWIATPVRSLARQLSVAAHEGNSAAALDILRDLHSLSSRYIDGSNSLISLLVGSSFQAITATKTCDVSDQLPLDDVQAAALADFLKSSPDFRAAWQRALVAESGFARGIFEKFEAGRYVHGMPHPVLSTLFLKKNQTLNRMHQQNRQLIKVGFKVFPSKAAAQAAGWMPQKSSKSGIGRYLNPNFVGNDIFNQDSISSLFPNLTGKFFFQPRAVQVRLAIYRWRLKHPGQWPVKLEELVPEFLPEIPADPWNGKPLTWDATSHVISAVGSDWKPDAPKFGSNRSWFSDDYQFPGLRCELPPAPPITGPASSSPITPKPKASRTP